MSPPDDRITGLLELAERCEKAAGPDRSLEIDIFVALNGDGAATIPHTKPFYTRSLDAAMTLVPEGCCIDMRRFDGGSEGFAQVRSSDATPDDADDELYVESEHCATLALALCAASLRARASQETSNADAG